MSVMRSSETRHDRATERRRARAQAHLARRRGNARPKLRRGPFVVTAVLAGVLGGIAGTPIAARLLGMQSQGIERLAVIGAQQVGPAEIAEAAGLVPGTPIGRIDTEALRSALEGEDWIARARSLPLPDGTLVVQVEERVAAARLQAGEQAYAVDAEGRAFAPVADDAFPSLPRIASTAPVDPATPSPALAQAVALARRLPELGIEAPAWVHVSEPTNPEGFALELEGLPARIVLGHRDPEARLGDLADLVSRRPTEVALATDIDLRFANQVVLRTAPAPEGSAHNAAKRGRATPAASTPTG